MGMATEMLLQATPRLSPAAFAFILPLVGGLLFTFAPQLLRFLGISHGAPTKTRFSDDYGLV
jgi:hypothetical protein